MAENQSKPVSYEEQRGLDRLALYRKVYDATTASNAVIQADTTMAADQKQLAIRDPGFAAEQAVQLFDRTFPIERCSYCGKPK